MEGNGRKQRGDEGEEEGRGSKGLVPSMTPLHDAAAPKTNFSL